MNLQQARLYLSPTAMSCLFTMGVTSKKHESRQSIPPSYAIPDEATRKLRAQLILEEAFETVESLGFDIGSKDVGFITFEDLELLPTRTQDLLPEDEQLQKIIDGACDTIYVATGLLCAVGAPDLPHMHAVNLANNAKFPGGKVITNPNTGKYLKPEGWVGPDKEHHRLIKNPEINLKEISDTIVRVSCVDQEKTKE